MPSFDDAFLAQVLDQLLDVVCVVDVQGRFLYVSAASQAVFGYTPEEMRGRRMIEMVHPDDRARTLNAVVEVVAGTHRPNFENRYLRKDGSVVDVMWTARWSPDRQMRIAVARDVTERKQWERRLRHAAEHDALTGLPNRTLLHDRLAQALERTRRHGSHLGVLFVDLDHFKQVNDRLGHAAGDRLLQETARRLQACLRGSDTVTRMGGDEFVVLLGDMPLPGHAAQVADKILAALTLPFALGGPVASVTASIGWAVAPRHGADCDQLIRQADEAMYRAKRAGGRRVEAAPASTTSTPAPP